jgi:hypothetical protein
MAYDVLKGGQVPSWASKEYLCILYQAARESEATVDDALRRLPFSPAICWCRIF